MTPELADKLWQIAKDAGILISILAIVIAIVFYIVRSVGEDRKRSAELNKQLASIVGSFSQLFDKINERLVKQDEQLDLLRLTVENTSTAKQAAIEHNATATVTSQKLIELNTQALIELRADYLKSWGEALGQMGTARGQIVQDVNAHTSEAHRLTGEAIAAARTENQVTHLSQTESAEKQMSDLRDFMAQNGKDTRAKIDDVLEKLEGISATIAELKTTLAAQGADASKFAEKLDQIGLDVDNIKKELATPPAPPPVDPLANLPKEPKKSDS